MEVDKWHQKTLDEGKNLKEALESEVEKRHRQVLEETRHLKQELKSQREENKKLKADLKAQNRETKQALSQVMRLLLKLNGDSAVPRASFVPSPSPDVDDPPVIASAYAEVHEKEKAAPLHLQDLPTALVTRPGEMLAYPLGLAGTLFR